MDVVSSEVRSLPSELLCADDLVIMAQTMGQLGRRVADWRASLLGKRLKVNAGKSKVMVGSSGGKMKFRELLPFQTSRAPPIGDERSSVCQLCQKQHDLWT